MSEMCPLKNGLKQGDVLLPQLFNFALEYAIRRVQVNQNGLKLNGTHHLLLLLYAVDVKHMRQKHTYYKEKHRRFGSS